MQAYFLRNLAEIAEKRAIGLRQEAQLWDILSRDIKREAGRKEELTSSKLTIRRSPSLEQEILPQRDDGKIFVRILEAARIMGISRSSLYKVINSGNLKIKKSGRNTLIAVSDIKAWSENLPEG